MGNCFKKESNGTIRVEEWNQSNASKTRAPTKAELREKLIAIERKFQEDRIN